MALVEKLRTLADAMPDGSLISLSVEWLRTELADEEVKAIAASDQVFTDFTVPALAAELGRSGSTVRGWLAIGEFPNAYKFRGKEWRIPRADVREWLLRERRTRASVDQATPTTDYADDDLGSWRKYT